MPRLWTPQAGAQSKGAREMKETHRIEKLKDRTLIQKRNDLDAKLSDTEAQMRKLTEAK